MSQLHTKKSKKQMNKLILYSIFVIILLISCKNSDKNVISDQTFQTQELPEDFSSFYKQFHSDSLFQISHITFPVEGKMKLTIGGQDTLITIFRNQDEWMINKFFDENNKQFQRQFIMVNDHMIIEKITGAEGLFFLERRFAKLSDGWNLIYYSEI